MPGRPLVESYWEEDEGPLSAKRILIGTIGSYGDLHPYIAIAQALQERGFHATIATTPSYREKIEAHGLPFYPVRPDLQLEDRELLERVIDRRRGTEQVFRLMAEHTREAYHDMLPAARQADVMLTHPLAVAAVAVAEQFQIPWVSSVLSPISFLSAWDPPAPPQTPWARHLRRLGVAPMRAFWNAGRRPTRKWIREVFDLRRELGLRDVHPLFEGQHSPNLVLALFSRLLAEPQPDWPPQTLLTGFPFFDAHHEQDGLPPEVERFFDEGPAPLVFTLGSSAVHTAGDFFHESVEAARSLGLRALLLSGTAAPQTLPPGMMAVSYAPHSDVFPRAAAVVHQGGIGTTAQSMRAGRPMLVVPFAHDQFDNAVRVERLGIARTLYRSRYNVRRAAAAVGTLLDRPEYAANARQVGQKIAAEDGAQTAADAIARFAAL